MKRGSSLPLLCALALACSAAAASPAYAQSSSSGSGNPGSQGSPPATPAANQKKAQEHFQRAVDLYGKGSYREAVDELEVARKLDPNAKNLLMNLGIVYEKLAKYDEAIATLKTYLGMDGITQAEQAKAEAMIKRIEGAKAKAAAADTAAPPPPPPSHPPAPPEHGRIDTYTIVAGSVAAAGLIAGTALGIYALTQRPSDFVTGRDGSYATLQDKTDSAHTLAIFADVGFGVGIVATVVTAWLYFGRTKDPAVKDSTAAHASAWQLTHVEAAPVHDGGAVLVGGTF